MSHPKKTKWRNVPWHQGVTFQKKALWAPFCEMWYEYYWHKSHVTAGDNRPQPKKTYSVSLTLLKGKCFLDREIDRQNIDRKLNLAFTFMNTFHLVAISSCVGLEIKSRILKTSTAKPAYSIWFFKCLLMIMSLSVAEHHRSLLDTPKRAENCSGRVPNPLTALISHFSLDSVDLLKDV